MLIEVKPRERVHLVDKHFVAFDKEVDSGQALAAEQPKHLDGKAPEDDGPAAGKLRGNTQGGTVSVDVFCLIRIESRVWLRHKSRRVETRECGHRFFQHGTFNLAPRRSGPVRQGFYGRSGTRGRTMLRFLVDPAREDPDGRSHIGGFHEQIVAPSAATGRGVSRYGTRQSLR